MESSERQGDEAADGGGRAPVVVVVDPRSADDDARASSSGLPVLVAKGLYVGGIEALKHIDGLRITHVVTVLNGTDDGDGDGGGDSSLVPAARPSDGYPIVRWRVPVDDLDDADLLTHLPGAVQFLQAALRQPRARCLVHCAQGVSRSAAVAAALFMSARKLPRAEQALALMRAGALPAGGADHLRPNDGFLAQLDLFGEMGWGVDETCAAYRAYRAERAAAAWLLEGGGGGGGAVDALDAMGAFARLPGETEDGEEDGPKAAAPAPAPTAPPPSTLYRCRRCRRLLATSGNEVPADWVRGRRTFGRMGRHTPAYEAAVAAAAAEAEQERLRHAPAAAEAGGGGAAASATSPAASASVVFVEPMRWMRACVAAAGASGKLYCPREGCPQRVGSFAWSGITSPSGAWVTPAFALQLARVDAVAAAAAPSSSGAAEASVGPATLRAPPVILPPTVGGGGMIRVPVLLGREARPPVVPVARARRENGEGGDGGSGGGGGG